MMSSGWGRGSGPERPSLARRSSSCSQLCLYSIATCTHLSFAALLARSVSERSSANNCCARCWPRAALTASARMIVRHRERDLPLALADLDGAVSLVDDDRLEPLLVQRGTLV